MKRIPFAGRVLLLGFGGVGRCALPLLLRHLDVPPNRVTVLDMAEPHEELAEFVGQGLRFSRECIRRETLGEQLAAHVGEGDLIIDLAWNIACVDLLSWCHENGVLYINTSVELWDPYADAESQAPQDRTLYVRHMAIRELMRSWGTENSPTAVLEHGANPGLVSHFTKMALLDIADATLRQSRDDTEIAELERLRDVQDFPNLSALLGVRAIHISEIDTQETSLPHDPDAFYNTWSVEGFYEEGTAPAEMGWGTHETALPEGACEHAEGPCNQICIDRNGMDTFVRTRVPSGEIAGMVIRHGEAFTLSEYLSVRDDVGKCVYRPTVHYAYCPCPAARVSLQDLRQADYKHPGTWHILGDDIISGRDELGVLLMGHAFQTWWTGSILDIEETRRLLPHQNATTLQVAISVVSAACWMIQNPNRGVLLPEHLPHEEIMQLAAPYLGDIVSQPIDWTPTGNPRTETWEFGNFLLPKPPRVWTFDPVPVRVVRKK